MINENTTPPSIAWVRKYVEGWFETFAKGLGAEVGDTERRLNKEMKAYTDEQSRLIHRLIELKEQSFAAQLASQAKTIKTLEARLAARKKDESVLAEYRPTMRKGTTPQRLM